MIDIIPADDARKPVVARLMRLYQHDLSEYDGSLPDADGNYPAYRYFDRYWIEDDRHPYVIYDGGIPIGFALVRDLDAHTRSLAEFFIIRAARGKGKGSHAATALFDRHPGQWQVAQQQENGPAQAFWRTVVNAYTGGDFHESWSDSAPVGPKQTFSTPD